MRTRFIALVLTLLVTVPLAAAIATPRAPVDAAVVRDFPTMYEIAAERAADFPFAPPPAGLDPVETARYMLHQHEFLGRTPRGWIDWAHATYNLEPVAATPVPEDADLVAAVLRLYAVAGLPTTPATTLAVASQAAALRPDLRAPFADLVATVASVYETHLPLANAIALRLATEGVDPTRAFVSREERDAMAASGAEILDALKLFEARAAPVFETMPRAGGSDAPLFADPEQLVVLGGLGDGTYTRGGLVLDPILIVEPDGDDLYLTTAGGACPDLTERLHYCNGLAISVVHDLAGNDEYRYDGVPMAVQGAGSTGGIGLLVDANGNDYYYAKLVRGVKGAFFSYLDAGAQGFSQAGFGLLLDGLGDDTYLMEVQSTAGRSQWAFGQGFGGLGSIGLSLDLLGYDQWLTNGLGITGGTGGFLGIYTHGSGFYAGVGLMSDTGAGDDVYHNHLESTTTDYYAEGFGAFAGLGILFEDGGNDDYYAVEKATNPWIVPLLNCAYGTGSLGGLGVFVDLFGNDRYYGDTISPKAGMTMNEGFGGIGAAFGLFVDVEGDDEHLMYASSNPGTAVGRGEWIKGGNIVGSYLDAGGNDVYVGPGKNDAVWNVGADLNLVPTIW